MIDFETARQYLELGFPVFPGKIWWDEKEQKFKKQPAIPWQRYQKEMPTLDDLHRWFDKPQHNGIAMATGRRGIVVLDFEASATEEDKKGADTSLISRTISGGEHRYFQTDKEIRNALRVGGLPVDIRASGGIVFLPPSSCNGKSYSWLTKPSLEILESLPLLPERFLQTEKVYKARYDWDNALGIEIGARDDILYRAADSLLARGISTDVAWQILLGINATYKPPLPLGQVKEKFENAVKFINNQSKTRFDNINSLAKKVLWPQQLRSQAFYGLAGEIVRAIEPHSEADPAALLVNTLVAFGSIVGDGAHFRVEADRHPMRLFCVLVGETSKSRKGTSWSHLRNIFGAIDEDWKQAIQSGLSSGEGLIWAVRNEITSRCPIKEKGRVVDYEDVITDPGVTDKRLLVVETEFASTLRVLGREGSTLSPIIRNAWDTGDLQALTKNSPAKATGAHVSILGHITKDELLRYLTDTETANGFGNRFLWFCVRRSKVLPFGSNIQKVDFAFLINRLREAIDFAKETEELQWAEETKPMWAEIYPSLSEGKPGLVGAMTARSEAYVIRLSCIYALFDKSKLIKPEHLLAAVAVWDYVQASVEYIFQGRSGDPLADDILVALPKHPEGMARTAISEYLGRHVASEQISEALKNLELRRLAKRKTVTTEGRNRELWVLNSNDGLNSLISLNSHAAAKSNTYLEKLKKYIKENNIPINPYQSQLISVGGCEKSELSEKRRDGLISQETAESLSPKEHSIPDKCGVCGGRAFWEREDGDWVCATCHPKPAQKGGKPNA